MDRGCPSPYFTDIGKSCNCSFGIRMVSEYIQRICSVPSTSGRANCKMRVSGRPTVRSVVPEPFFFVSSIKCSSKVCDRASIAHSAQKALGFFYEKPRRILDAMQNGSLPHRARKAPVLFVTIRRNRPRPARPRCR